MRQITWILLLLIVIMAGSGCASFTAFKSGIVTSEYMIGLLPVSNDVYIFLNFKQMEMDTEFTELITSGMYKDGVINKFMKDCNIDPEEDLYSICASLSEIKPENLTKSGTVIINLNYDSELVRQRLLLDGYKEEKAGPGKVAVFTNSEDEDQVQVVFLSNDLILLATGSNVRTVLDQHYGKKRDKAARPFITTLDKKSMDVPFLCSIRNISKNIPDSGSSNPFLRFFTNVDEIIASFNFTRTDLISEIIFVTKDENQRDVLHTLLYLAIQGSDDIDNEAVREIFKHMVLSKEEEVVKVSIEIPILTIMSLFNENKGVFL